MTDTTNDEDAPCLGTTSIAIQAETGKKKKGVLAVFLHPQRLGLTASDGTTVYEGVIEMDQVDMNLLDSIEDKTTALAEFILDSTSKVKTKYALQSDDRVKVAIQYQAQDGKSKKAWGGVLTPGKDLFQFCQRLGGSINQGQQQLQIANEDMAVLRDEREGWKSTAEKLEGAWQTEKDTVLSNFVTLYNKTREELEKTQHELSAAKMALEMNAPTVAKKKTKRIKREEEEFPEQPDDYDHNDFGDELINALASKQRVDLTAVDRKKKPAPKKKRKVKEESDEENTSHKARKKPPAKKERAPPKKLPFQVDKEGLFSSDSDVVTPTKPQKPIARTKTNNKPKRKLDLPSDEEDQAIFRKPRDSPVQKQEEEESEDSTEKRNKIANLKAFAARMRARKNKDVLDSSDSD